ncbi:MAG: metal-sensitive transcriptional regulator [Deltaproteobacteria bacterium]|nr:metal-sensitive transcriptional regulator [Deltaproteobacteria bacterium]
MVLIGSKASPEQEGQVFREQFPDHEGQIVRISRIEGQIKGVRKMIEERRYCIDIAMQIKAITSALKQVEMGVLEKHVHHCMRQAVKSGNAEVLDQKMEEIIKVLARME